MFGEEGPSQPKVAAHRLGQLCLGELPIPDVTVRLVGVNVLGNPVDQQVVTDSDGFYHFGDLYPGTYAIGETHPGAFVDGKDTVGSQGGDARVNDLFTIDALNAGVEGTDNNFGELGNITRWGNSQFDRLVGMAQVEQDQARRAELYRNAEKIAYDEAPWLMLFWKNSATLVQPYVRDLEITQMDRTPQLNNAPLEKVWFEAP